jgi:hypothetical protein
MTRPRCAKCAKPTALQATLAGRLCKRCVSRLPPHLLRDPDQPRPNADSSHRRTKTAGAGTPQPNQRPKLPPPMKGAKAKHRRRSTKRHTR